MPCRNKREQRNIPCWEEQSEMCMHRHGTGDLERQCVERLSWLLSQQNQILCESKLATKMSLLIGGSKQDYAYINKQYIDIPILKTKMPIKYKIILILMLCKCYSIVYFILKKMYAHNVK